MTPSPSPGSQAGKPRRSISVQPAATDMADASLTASRRYQLQVGECVETRTVTTTTRLTRKFPPGFSRDPTPLDNLDSKEYPLAAKPTPPQILLDLAESTLGEVHDDDVRGAFDATAVSQPPPTRPMDRPAGVTFPPMTFKLELAARQPVEARPALDGPSRSPSGVYPRRTRQTRASLADSPTATTTNTVSAAAAVSQSLPPLPAPLARNPRALARSSNLSAVADKLRRSVVQGGGAAIRAEDPGYGALGVTGRHGAGERQARAGSGFLDSPDASELFGSSSDRPPRRRSLHLDPLQSSPTDSSAFGNSQLALCAAEAAISEGGDPFAVFSSNVATPPITDADAAPFADADEDEALQQSVRGLHNRPTIDVVAAQDASLPSPRLSPTLAASQPASADQDDDATASFRTSVTHPGSSWVDESSAKQDGGAADLGAACLELEDARFLHTVDAPLSPRLPDTQTMLEAFESMKTEMKTYMMYQFLRRCPRSTLRIIADNVNPALKCDFILQLPLELAYNVLSYLDCQDLCRAARVSKHWRSIVDRNETGWKELFDRDGFVLPSGELAKAIVQGWGWQDPFGANSYERDMSMRGRLSSSDFELSQSSAAVPKQRASKRKRAINSWSTSERSKRRVAGAQAAGPREQTAHIDVRQHKSEGPLSAANAAAAAVPDQLGLPNLRQLHLFKSLYRRHYMIRRSWTSGDVKPSHVAFAAHPRHVITCLQFDDDKIITGSDDTLIHIYDTKTGKLRKRLEGHEGGVWALQYEGNVLVSGSTDRSVRVWDIERGLCQQVFFGHTSTVRCLQILMPAETGMDTEGRPVMQPEKPLIITGSRDSQLRVWNLPEDGSRRYIQTHPPALESDCPYFVRSLAGHSHSVRAISAHGDTLVSGSYDSTVRVWRISTGDALHVLRGHSQKVYSVVLDHERNRCISGSMDSLVKIWDLATGSCIHTLEGHSLLVGLLDLRDERLVSAAADSTLRIWDPETGRCRHTLMAHTGAITCFQHDGHKVVSGSEKTVKMWDVKTGECVQDLLTDLGGVWQVKFDGRRCVAAVQRDQLTYVEILDFGAVRDGHCPEELGKRVLLNGPEVQEVAAGGPA